MFDVEELPTHGGSLRVYAQRADTGPHAVVPRVSGILEREKLSGLRESAIYAGFQGKTDRIKNEFLGFLLDAHRNHQSVAAYGAAAKGNTLMNYAGVRPDLISFVADRNPAKQGKFTPGGRIPIVAEALLMAARPDFVVILPWNIKDEVMAQLSYVRDWGGKFVTAVPELRITP